MRVLVGEHRRAEVVDPRGPEQVALVVLARRVVGERVEQRVEHVERARRGSASAAARSSRAGLQLRDRRAATRARTGRISSRITGVVLRQERPRLGAAPGRARGRRAAAPASVGPSSSASAVGLGQRRLRRVERRRQLLQRRAQARVLARERRRRPRSSSRRTRPSWSSLPPSASTSSEKLWMTRWMFAPPRGELLGDLARCRARSARSGGSCCASVARRCRRSASAPLGQQQQEVGRACRRRARRGSRRG